MLPIVSHPDYDIPLPPGHRFVASKFSALMTALGSLGLMERMQLHQPESASPQDLAQVHDPAYVEAFASGTLSDQQLKTLGLKWSPQLVKRSFISPNGTLLAAKLALKQGLACHAAGGTHHAHFDHGAGFCVFNDMAYAAKQLIATGQVAKVLILDCDVHQGDGTARILADEPNIFTCSLHCRINYPQTKATSDWDVELEADLGDADYLATLNQVLADLPNRFAKPDLVIYDAGVDAYEGDRLGRLSLSYEGLRARDEQVLAHFTQQNIPVATVIGGGYSAEPSEVAFRHSLIFQAALKVKG